MSNFGIAPQATCEGAGFLPMILSVSAALTGATQQFVDDRSMINWNVAPDKAEAFAASASF
jgi:hypothetical protein